MIPKDPLAPLTDYHLNRPRSNYIYSFHSTSLPIVALPSPTARGEAWRAQQRTVCRSVRESCYSGDESFYLLIPPFPPLTPPWGTLGYSRGPTLGVAHAPLFSSKSAGSPRRSWLPRGIPGVRDPLGSPSGGASGGRGILGIPRGPPRTFRLQVISPGRPYPLGCPRYPRFPWVIPIQDHEIPHRIPQGPHAKSLGHPRGTPTPKHSWGIPRGTPESPKGHPTLPPPPPGYPLGYPQGISGCSNLCPLGHPQEPVGVPQGIP